MTPSLLTEVPGNQLATTKFARCSRVLPTVVHAEVVHHEIFGVFQHPAAFNRAPEYILHLRTVRDVFNNISKEVPFCITRAARQPARIAGRVGRGDGNPAA